MKFNVGIKGKGYCFVNVDMSIEEYDEERTKAHKIIMNAIKEKYGNVNVMGYCPVYEEQQDASHIPTI